MKVQKFIAIICLVIGFLLGSHYSANLQPVKGKLVSTRFESTLCCGKDKVAASRLADGAPCEITVIREYCQIITYPSPQRICTTVVERIPGRWSAARGCCQAFFNNQFVCVK